MTDKIVKPQVSKPVINPVMAAMAGAVVAGAAVAGAMIMSDKKNQDKVRKVVSNVKDSLNNNKASIISKADKLEDITKNTVNELKNI
ncbi:MAG: hypothetical protein WC686_03115 [Candidatus Shapirobacteria bacterium]|jgi:hypothetical protein